MAPPLGVGTRGQVVEYPAHSLRYNDFTKCTQMYPTAKSPQPIPMDSDQTVVTKRFISFLLFS
ncbi:MAG: hypothetical protein GX467_01910 [Rikenellaceae bacterium]|nr:hypothetical protein [Rikenellaceae bacterium]